jgi:hypothetical protein
LPYIDFYSTVDVMGSSKVNTDETQSKAPEVTDIKVEENPEEAGDKGSKSRCVSYI